uniref:Ctr_45_T conopeptide n=1 Tax=Conus tribblei TaxID=101761 RepID=A0A0C9SFM0_CONTD
MTPVWSVTCCCLLWPMLSVQLVTPGSPAPAQEGILVDSVEECPEMCEEGGVDPLCECPTTWNDLPPWIGRRKMSTVA